jgi:predicted DNA-binding transcriptional regulator AlpA
MRIGKLALKIGVSRSHAWRMAKAGAIPSVKKTNGGHYYFIEGPTLNRWISRMNAAGNFRKNVMAKAYDGCYGSTGEFAKRTLRNQMKEFKRNERRLSGFNRRTLLSHDVDDYWFLFHRSIIELKIILKDWDEFQKTSTLPWPKQIKSEMAQRVIRLRETIDEFLSDSKDGKISATIQ